MGGSCFGGKYPPPVSLFSLHFPCPARVILEWSRPTGFFATFENDSVGDEAKDLGRNGFGWRLFLTPTTYFTSFNCKFAYANIAASRSPATFCIAKLVAALRLTSKREAWVKRFAFAFDRPIGGSGRLFMRVVVGADPYQFIKIPLISTDRGISIGGRFRREEQAPPLPVNEKLFVIDGPIGFGWRGGARVVVGADPYRFIKIPLASTNKYYKN